MLEGYRVEVRARSFEGYKLVSDRTKDLRVSKDGDNTIRFNYEEDRDLVRYTVEYQSREELKDGSSQIKTISGPYEYEGREGTTVSVKALKLDGYNLIAGESQEKSITLNKGKDNAIVFTYEGSGYVGELAPESYIEIKYYDKDNNKLIDSNKVHGIQGTKINERGKVIPGYKLLDTGIKSGTIGETKTITFNYEAGESDGERPGNETNDNGSNENGSNNSGPSNNAGENNEINDNDGNNVDPEGNNQIQNEITLEKNIHDSYITGYQDNTIRPDAQVSREEVATIFFRILTDSSRNSLETDAHSFWDVEAGRWSEKYIATLAAGKVINGYQDGSFRPEDSITRAEVATIVSKFSNDNEKESTGNKFTDIDGHWAYDNIIYASSQGWILGYQDGSFRPDDYITRAELITLVNGVLDRSTSVDQMLPGRIEYNDLSPDMWYYEAVQEAINSHDYIIMENGAESWTTLRN